jgi:hypothetical protein
MKKILNLLLIFLFIIFTCIKSEALNFEEAFNQSSSKPMVALIYAQWADDYSNYLQAFNLTKTQMGDKYNFVELDIASEDTKFFNEKFHIYPNLPYILMFRDGGKVSRYIQKDCALDSQCIVTKLKSFIL